MNACLRLTAILILALVSGILSGCQKSVPKSPVIKESPVPPVAAVSEPQPIAPPRNMASDTAVQGTASVCQRELLALSKVSPKTYARKKAAFDTLLRSASVYTSVRDEIGGQTRDTMDALYKYKTQKLCSDIQQAVRDGLIVRGEEIK